MKRVGIVCDNYKLEKFKKELISKGFTDFDITPFVDNTSMIRVMTPENRISEINKICQKVELHYKRSN